MINSKITLLRKTWSDNSPLVAFTVVGVVIILIGAKYGQSHFVTKNEQVILVSKLWFFDAIMAIGASVVAAGIVVLLQKLYELTGKQQKIAILELLIGHNDWEKIAIVLPIMGFATDENTVAPNQAYRNTLSDDNNVVWQKYSVKDDALLISRRFGYEDIDAARKISSIFTSLNLPQPKLHYDDYTTKILYPDTAAEGENDHVGLSDIKTFICIGLYSNEVVMRVSENNDLFKLASASELDSGRWLSIFDVTTDNAQWKKAGIGNHRVLTSDITREDRIEDIGNKRDFALIAKHTLIKPSSLEDVTCIFLGGGSARGTKSIGRWFRANFDRIPFMQTGGVEDRVLVKNHDFAFGFDIDGGQNRGEYAKLKNSPLKKVLQRKPNHS